MPTVPAPIGLDLDLNDLVVLGVGKRLEVQAAAGALRRVKLNDLQAFRQIRLHRAGVAPLVRLLASTTGGRRACQLLTAALVAIPLAAEHPLLKFTNLGLRQVQLCAQRCFTLRGLILELPVGLSAPTAFPRCAMASTAAEQHAAVMAEVQQVLDWAWRQLHESHGPIDDGMQCWSHDP